MSQWLRRGSFGLFFVLASLMIWQRVQTMNAAYHIKAQQNERVGLIRIRDARLLEEERLAASGRIEQIASKQLGMRRTHPQQRIYISEGSP